MNSALSDIRRTFALTQLWLHLGWSDVARRYRRTLLGPLWHTLTLGIFIICMGAVWATVLKIEFRTYAIHLTPNLIVWSFISSIFIEGANVFLNARQTVLTVNVPYPVLVLGLVWKLAITFAHHLLLLVVLMIVFGIAPNANTLLLIPGLFLGFLNGLWIAMFIGIVCLRVRDLQMIVTVAMQIAQFVTPVFWPVELISPKLGWVVHYNPLYHLLQIIREPLIGHAPALENWYWAVMLALAGFFCTMVVYIFTRNRMAYWF